MNFILTTLLTIFIFGIIITIHEFGHFIFAKKGGITVHEFAIGMGPKIFAKEKNGTVYTLRALPIGGYVQMEGEDEESDDANSFGKKSIGVRISVIVAGAALNLILGFIILTGINITSPQHITNKIAVFNENSISQNSGLSVGDDILKVNGRKILIADDIIFELLRDKDGILDFTVNRNGETVNLDAVTFQKIDKPEGKSILDVDFKVKAEKNSLLKSMKYSFLESISKVRIVGLSFLDLITGNVSVSELSGPIGVGSVVSDAMSFGLRNVLYVIAFLSINIGVFNLLPLPALDGGRLLFLIIELLRGKPINPKYEGMIHSTGLILLLGLMLFTTFQDVFKLIF